MPLEKNAASFELEIQAEISQVQDQTTSRTIYELLEHTKKKEKEADNRELRPRPDGSENAAYYQSEIDFSLIPSSLLQETVAGLLNYLVEIENLLANAN